MMIAITPATFKALEVSIFLTRACGSGLRKIFPWHMPGTFMSAR